MNDNIVTELLNRGDVDSLELLDRDKVYFEYHTAQNGKLSADKFNLSFGNGNEGVVGKTGSWGKLMMNDYVITKIGFCVKSKSKSGKIEFVGNVNNKDQKELLVSSDKEKCIKEVVFFGKELDVVNFKTLATGSADDVVFVASGFYFV